VFGLAPGGSGRQEVRMDRWLLATSALLAALGGGLGMMSVHHGVRSKWTVVWAAGAFLLQFAFLFHRGQLERACPLRDHGEVLGFLAWSLLLFFLLVGPAYRVSLLGVFTLPLVVVMQLAALVPGVLHDVTQQAAQVTNGLREAHAALSVLAYGAMALAAVAGVMFLVLDRQLKEMHLKSGLFRNLPPARELLQSQFRLMVIGLVIMTGGVVVTVLMPHDHTITHVLSGAVVWLGYAALIGVKVVRGISGRRSSLAVVAWFLVSLVVFAIK